MSISYSRGKPIAKFIGKGFPKEILHVDEEEKYNGKKCTEFIIPEANKYTIEPIMNTVERAVEYIAGPSGSGKTTMTVNLANNFLKIYPNIDVYLFSRTDWQDDPAFRKLRKKPLQIPINENLLLNPIDINTELNGGSLVIFDDISTVQNEKQKKAIQSLICDILEVGRKLKINIILTNHLVCPADKNFSRCIMNELQVITLFPRSGTSQQIRYCLKTYFGLDKNQIERILKLPSRWVRICRTYPMYVLYSKGMYIIN